jgi:hypothetical protein
MIYGKDGKLLKGLFRSLLDKHRKNQGSLSGHVGSGGKILLFVDEKRVSQRRIRRGPVMSQFADIEAGGWPGGNGNGEFALAAALLAVLRAQVERDRTRVILRPDCVDRLSTGSTLIV